MKLFLCCIQVRTYKSQKDACNTTKEYLMSAYLEQTSIAWTESKTNRTDNHRQTPLLRGAKYVSNTSTVRES